ncbi:MAG: ABC transporter ATP-binding protein [Methanosphaera sp.]|nr:ABC transporter ATP-binding protein [Methanosphaera sp.]
MAKTLIKLDDVVKAYDDGQIKALNGVNIEIMENEFVSIIGPSGSGKSTLLNMMGALDVPDSGSIIINDVDLTSGKDLSKFRRKNIGFIFQLHNLIPNLSVQENVEIPLLETNTTEKESKKRSKEMLEAVGLGDRLGQNPTKLSGGQRQRVAIARALINNPPIILADEPTGALDQKTGKKILNLLKELHQKSNVTLIIVTHDPNVAKQADRTIEIMDGEVINDYEN